MIMHNCKKFVCVVRVHSAFNDRTNVRNYCITFSFSTHHVLVFNPTRLCLQPISCSFTTITSSFSRHHVFVFKASRPRVRPITFSHSTHHVFVLNPPRSQRTTALRTNEPVRFFNGRRRCGQVSQCVLSTNDDAQTFVLECPYKCTESRSRFQPITSSSPNRIFVRLQPITSAFSAHHIVVFNPSYNKKRK